MDFRAKYPRVPVGPPVPPVPPSTLRSAPGRTGPAPPLSQLRVSPRNRVPSGAPGQHEARRGRILRREELGPRSWGGVGASGSNRGRRKPIDRERHFGRTFEALGPSLSLRAGLETEASLKRGSSAQRRYANLDQGPGERFRPRGSRGMPRPCQGLGGPVVALGKAGALPPGETAGDRASAEPTGPTPDPVSGCRRVLLRVDPPPAARARRRAP
jgi:hypothetical protein